MQVTRHTEGTLQERTGEPLFLGSVWGRGLVAPPASSDFTAAIVTFAVGARTRLHRHSSDQLLYIVHGIGKVGTTDGEHLVGVGDTVLIPAHEDHWHGAADSGSPMAHLTVTRNGSETTIAD